MGKKFMRAITCKHCFHAIRGVYFLFYPPRINAPLMMVPEKSETLFPRAEQVVHESSHTGQEAVTVCKHCLHLIARSDCYGHQKAQDFPGRGPVVSVRLEPELIERLDALSERSVHAGHICVWRFGRCCQSWSVCTGNKRLPISKSSLLKIRLRKLLNI